jgi:hypothetical protein
LCGWKNNCCQNTWVSHLFWCFFKNLNVLRHWIFLLFQNFGQEFASNGWCKWIELSLLKIFWRWHLNCSQNTKPNSLWKKRCFATSLAIQFLSCK